MPWTQAEFNNYMQLVRSANPDYEKHKKSSLHEVTGLLKLKRFQSSQSHVQALTAAWNRVPANKRQIYTAAWTYAMSQIQPNPIMHAVPVPQPRAIPVPTPQPRAVAPLPGLVPNSASQIAQMRAGLRPVAGQPALTPPPSPPPAPAQVAIAAQIQAGRAARDQQVATTVQQFHNGVAYDWPVNFTLRPSGAGGWKSITVLLTIAAFSGNGNEHQTAVLNNRAQPIPSTHTGATLTEAVKLNWKYRINERWSGAVFQVLDLQGDPLDQYTIEFDFNWVTNAAQACQTVYAVQTTDASQPPDGTINTMYWGINDGGNMGAAIAHEFGHLIGNPDEYGVCTFRGRRNSNDSTSIMCDETKGKAKPGHFYLIANEICTLLNVSPQTARIRLDNKSYNVWANHPWQ